MVRLLDAPVGAPPRGATRAGPAALLLAGLGLAGCLGVEVPRPGAELRLRADQVLVFGRLHVREGQRDIVPTPELIEEVLWPGDAVTFQVSLYQVENGAKALYPSYERDGHFWWVVPRGTYLVFHTPRGKGAYNAVLAAFQAPHGAQPVYVGTLVVQIDTRMAREYDVEYVVRDVHVADELEAAREELVRRHPGTREGRPALMFTDPELTGLLDPWSRRECDRILERHGVRALDR